MEKATRLTQGSSPLKYFGVRERESQRGKGLSLGDGRPRLAPVPPCPACLRSLRSLPQALPGWDFSPSVGGEGGRLRAHELGLYCYFSSGFFFFSVLEIDLYDVIYLELYNNIKPKQNNKTKT